MLYALLFAFGFIAFTISTIAGGGGALILVPLVNFFVSKEAVAPLVHLGNFIGRPTRIFLFWSSVRWDVVKSYLPAGIIGGFIGAWFFATLELEWLQLIIGFFLVSTIWQFRFGKKSRSFPMKQAYFAPLGFVVCMVSSIVGATGAVLNPFYLNYGVIKEELVATKAVNSFGVAIVQLGTYSFFGKLTGELWFYGLAIGAGAAAGNFLGKKWLKRISDQRFRIYVVLVMVISGVLILYRELPAFIWSAE